MIFNNKIVKNIKIFTIKVFHKIYRNIYQYLFLKKEKKLRGEIILLMLVRWEDITTGLWFLSAWNDNCLGSRRTCIYSAG